MTSIGREIQAVLRAPAQAPRLTTQREVLRVRIRDLQVPVMVTIDAPYAPLCLDIDLIHKWLPIHYSFVLVQISLPSLTLEQEFFSV